MRISDWSSDVCSSDLRADQLLGQREGRGEADEFRPALLDPVDRARWGEAAGEDDMPDVVLLADVDQLHDLGMHGDEVDAEGPGRPLLRLGDLGVEQVRRHGPAGDDAEAASVGDGGDEVALRNPAHRAAHDGDLAAEEIGAALHQADRKSTRLNYSH